MLEYPNIDENQNSDIGGTFTGKVTIEQNDASPDITIIGTYIEENGEYKKTNSIPSEGYELNTEQSTCSNNATVGWDSSNNRVYVENLNTSGTECTLYYDEVILASDIILGKVTINESTPDFSQIATTDEGVYKAEDDLGTSYYFRGAVTNNYVSFAGYYWRIIRINGDGSIRIIYDGTTAHANRESSADRQTGTSAYNSSWNASYYVGYTYQINMQRPSTQNSGTASTIKGVLDSWYSTNITNQGLDDKVVSTPGFCNDRNIASGSNWVASGTTFYYAAYERLFTNKTPTLECNNTNDIYTTKIGLITADELSMAGGVYGQSNNSYYLYTGQTYWSMSPSYFYATLSYAYVFFVDSTGQLYNFDVHWTDYGVRPVLNLSADVTISSGDGTMNNPYVVN